MTEIGLYLYCDYSKVDSPIHIQGDIIEVNKYHLDTSKLHIKQSTLECIPDKIDDLLK